MTESSLYIHHRRCPRLLIPFQWIPPYLFLLELTTFSTFFFFSSFNILIALWQYPLFLNSSQNTLGHSSPFDHEYLTHTRRWDILPSDRWPVPIVPNVSCEFTYRWKLKTTFNSSISHISQSNRFCPYPCCFSNTQLTYEYVHYRRELQRHVSGKKWVILEFSSNCKINRWKCFVCILPNMFQWIHNLTTQYCPVTCFFHSFTPNIFPVFSCQHFGSALLLLTAPWHPMVWL